MVKGTLRLFLLCAATVWFAACGDNIDGTTVDAGDDDTCTPVDDSNECTTDVCEAGVPVHNPLPAGTACTGGACDDSGTCVPTAPTCTDKEQNGDETGVDCGGSCAPASTCDTDEGCAVAADCTSGVCGDDMLCEAAACGDGVEQTGEACDDGNMTNGDGCDDGPGGTCRPTGCGNGTTAGGEECDDGNATNGDGCDNNCTTTSCGNEITAGTEECDDGDIDPDDGCSATCTIETGYTCTPTVPSVCSTTCGDGIPAGTEGCDDAPPTEDGDGCSATCTVETGYSCSGTPSVCTLDPVCGNGVIEGPEACDDSNTTPGDGCSATCAVDITCAPGETPVIVTNTTPLAIPDSNATGVQSPMTIATAGALSKLTVTLTNLPHEFNADLDMFLIAPSGLQRELSTDNGSTLPNYFGTQLDDAAAVSITTAVAPMTGRFRPEQSLTTTVGTDFAGVNGAGTWNLKLVDDGTGDLGTLNSWTIAACINTTAPYCGDGTTNTILEECDDGNTNNTDACSNSCQIVDGCGDGNLDAGELCDDNNVTAGDGCSATCLPDITCAADETPVVLTNSTALAIPDNNTTGVQSPMVVATTGGVTKVGLVISSLSHTDTGDVDLFLIGPSGIQREVSTDNSSGGDHYRGTQFDDAATTSITGGTAPFTGRFRPEFSLSTTAGTDFRGLGAAGTWNLRVADDASGDTGTLESWTLLACVNPTAPFCGDGATNSASEECDDGNTDNADACSNTCQITDGCGDGNIDAGEVCDDNNIASGDGCSSACVFDIGCGAGETPVIVTTPAATAVPDTILGLFSNASVGTAGLVRRVIATVDVTTSANGNFDLFLRSPWGVQRELVTDVTGASFTRTVFADDAATLITAGTAPFTGRFRPEMTISDAAGFGNQTAAGNWELHIAKDTTGGTATLNSWTLAVCVDTSATSVCGNGVVEDTEGCDDLNTTAGDGCSATCAIELTCAAGSSPVVVRGGGTLPLVIPDNNTTGVTSAATVVGAGTVTDAVVVIGTLTHQYQTDMDISLISPMGTAVDLSSDNTSGLLADYVSTFFDDAAATAVSAVALSPLRGRFRPEAMLSLVDGQAAAGDWQLKMVDDAGQDTGLLVSWSIGLCVAP
jgi:cysteine-rich repeat protein